MPDPDNPSVEVGPKPLPFKTIVKVAPSGPEEGTTLVNCGAGDCENALLESKNKAAIRASLAMDRTDLRFSILPLEISFDVFWRPHRKCTLASVGHHPFVANISNDLDDVTCSPSTNLLWVEYSVGRCFRGRKLHLNDGEIRNEELLKKAAAYPRLFRKDWMRDFFELFDRHSDAS